MAEVKEVKFDKKNYKVIAELSDLYILEGGVVVAKKDCKEVKDEKPKAAKKKKD